MAQPNQAGYGSTSGYPPPPAGAAPPGGYHPQAGYQGQPHQGYQHPPPPGQAYPPQGQAYPPQGQTGGLPPPPVGAAVGPPAGALPTMPAGMAPPPSEDVMDDPNAHQHEPSAPPLEKMDAIPGYNNVGFGAANYLPPPSYDDAISSQPPPEQRPLTRLRQLTEEEARIALVDHVNQQCCWGGGPAKQMIIRDLTPASVFHYTLETFGEARSTAWAYEPYNGGPVDTPASGMAPAPWDIPLIPSQMFINNVSHTEVPHTASIKPCHDCLGMGKRQCYRCRGRGRVRCHTCHGHGHNNVGNERRKCTWCHGHGRRRCDTCHTHGLIRCDTCKGYSNLKCFIKLTIKWTNHYEDKIQQDCALPQDMVRSVTGDIAFQEEQPLVYPVNHFPDQRINSASKSLVDKHRSDFPSERLLRQRHKVRNIPITEVIYDYKGKVNSFWVYGKENCVYAPKYPAQCCCGCTIL